jgi:hypothetical protein
MGIFRRFELRLSRRGWIALLLLLLIALVLGPSGTPGTAQGNAASTMLPREGLRAVWVGSTNPSQNTLVISGSGVHIVGGLHSNGGLHITGLDIVVEGPASYTEGSQLNVPPDAFLDQYPTPTTVQPYPLTYHIEDYRPGGAKALEAAARGEYYYTAGDLEESWLEANGLIDTRSRALKDGLYYAGGEIHLNHLTLHLGSKVTFAAEGAIGFGPYDAPLTAYSDDLLLFSNTSDPATGAIKFSGSGIHDQGDLFAPNGHIQLIAMDVTIEGYVVGDTVDIIGSNYTITCDIGSTVTTTADSGPGSLRQAILDANALPGTALITFNIPGAGPHTIAPLTELPRITDPVIIDGTTQPGASCESWPPTLTIELDGENAGDATSGLNLYTDNSLVRGLVVNRFSESGVNLNGNDNAVGCNFIGTDLTGTVASGNRDVGIDANGSNRIGTDGDGIADNTERNVISANGEVGVTVGGPDAVVAGNYIGTDSTGSSDLGSQMAGVIPYSDTIIGGPLAVQANIIAFNKTYGGILMTTACADGCGIIGNGNTFQRNSIHSNEGLGIELNALMYIHLGVDGVTPNDPGDADSGPNNLQNYPVLTSATETAIAGTLNSTPNTTFTLEFFSNTECDPSGYGEGETFQPTTAPATVTTDAGGWAALLAGVGVRRRQPSGRVERRVDVHARPAAAVRAEADPPEGSQPHQRHDANLRVEQRAGSGQLPAPGVRRLRLQDDTGRRVDALPQLHGARTGVWRVLLARPRARCGE